VERGTRMPHSHEVDGLSRAAANGTDSRLFLEFTCAAALAGLLAIPRLVRPCRSPDWTFELSSDSFPSPRSSQRRLRHRGCPPHRRLACVLLRATSAGPPGLRSSSEVWFHRPGRGFPTTSPGIRPGSAHCRRHCCRSRARCSGPSRPSIDLVPGVHSRADIAAVASVTRCQPRDPVPTSPFCTVPPVFSADRPALAGLCAVASAGFPGLLHPVADPGVRCVSLRRPGGSSTPHPPPCDGLCAAGHANAASSQRVSYPLEDSPHPQPCRVTATVAPLMFASRAAPIGSSPPLPVTSSVS